MERIRYPRTNTVEQVDDYHGTLVRDPYRWLENVDSPETLDWVRQQNELTFSYLEQIPARSILRSRLSKLWNFAKTLPPFKRGDRYFQFRNSGLQNQNVLWVSRRTQPSRGKARQMRDRTKGSGRPPKRTPGITFQLPLVMLFLERIGVFTVATYLSYWRVAILVIFVMAAVFTPPDPFSMSLLAFPLSFLYFGGILLCKLMPKGRGLLPVDEE